MENNRIVKEMRELELKIHYHFNNIQWLARAMGAIKIPVPGQGKNGTEYANDGLATVGDTILKSVIAAEYLYRNGIQTKGEITAQKSALENNATMHRLTLGEGILGYAYNDLHFASEANIPDHEKVSQREHDPYVEAIVGAVYYDSNYDTTKRWILKWLLPLLEKYM